jgi:hypothetical protein
MYNHNTSVSIGDQNARKVPYLFNYKQGMYVYVFRVLQYNCNYVMMISHGIRGDSVIA